MKIRMLVSVAGVDFALAPGEVTERFGDEDAVRLVQADFAVVIAGDTEAAVQVPMGEVRIGAEGEAHSEDGAPAVDPPAGEDEASAVPAGETSEADDKVALQAEAEALGVDVDKRWGIARLKSEIEAAKAKAAG